MAISEDQKAKNRRVWDCGSSLYDSFELKSFERQLDSAISARTLSMPHISSDLDPSRTFRGLPPPPQQQQRHLAAAPPPSTKKSRKISKSLNRLLRSVFRFKPQTVDPASLFRVQDPPVYVLCDKSGTLTTIPEAPEVNFGADHGGYSPDMKSLARRTVSDRFTPTSIGISCA